MRIRLCSDPESHPEPGLTALNDFTTVFMQPGQTVAQTVWLSGLAAPRALCSGLGRCGACRLRFVENPPLALPIEQDVLSADELSAGFRLTCRHPALSGMILEIPDPQAASVAVLTLPEAMPGTVRLAVDLGTTSLCWQAFSPDGWSRSGRELNPQMGAGSDVMSRIATALLPQGRRTLQNLTLTALRRIVAELPPVAEICVAGNTAMTAILLGRDCAGLAGAPYSRPETGNRDVRLPDLPPLWIPPQPAPFVGGDVSAGLAALLAGNPDFPLLLADMGTNGEFALMRDAHSLLLTSVPLGPSLEGIGLRHGTLAGEGAVTTFSLGPQGLMATVWPGSTAVHGISGTGYLSLLHCLRQADVIDSYGRLNAAPASPLGKKIRTTVRTPKNTPWRLPLPHGLDLCATDAEELIKVRAAFSLAVSALLAAADLSAAELAGVYVAGALGEHVSPQALEGLGFLPAGLGARLHALGNTSLAGAALLLRVPKARATLAALCDAAIILDLTASPDFMQHYMERMELAGFR